MLEDRSPRWWYYVAVPGLAVALALGLIEALCAAFWPIPLSIESNMYFAPDQYTGYKLEPNSVGYFQQEIPARANEHGHRDDAIAMQKPEGVLRILLLGDSFTVGANVAQDVTYAAVLESLLNEDSVTPIELINAGVGGWEPFQYAQYYEHYGRAFSPDLILVGFFVGNDTYDQTTDIRQTRTARLGRRISREAAMDPLISIKVFSYNRFNVARLLLNKGPAKREFTRTNCSEFTRQYITIQRPRLNNHLKRSSRQQQGAENGIYQILRIKELAERDSIPLSVVLLPDEIQINRDLQQVLLADHDRSEFDFDMPQSMLRDLFDEAEIPVFDLLPYIRDDARCLYMNDTHWTPEGHSLAATLIYRYITNWERWPNRGTASGKTPLDPVNVPPRAAL